MQTNLKGSKSIRNREENFARSNGQLRAKPPVFWEARCENNYLNKKIRRKLKILRFYATYVLVRSRTHASTLGEACSNLMIQSLKPKNPVSYPFFENAGSGSRSARSAFN
jgi:hypothetical protein